MPKGFKSLFVFLDFGNFHIQAWDEAKLEDRWSKIFRWSSHEFRIYSKNCIDPVENITCSLENYAFGPAISKHSNFLAKTEKDCTEECNDFTHCLYTSWDRKNETCHFQRIEDDFVYFCKKNDSISFRKENSCKDMEQVKNEESLVAMTTRVINPNVTSNHNKTETTSYLFIAGTLIFLFSLFST